MFNKFNVMSVIIFILLMDLFFYFGTTINSPKSDSIQVIVQIVQVMSGLATITGVSLACKTYNDWSSRITHPDKYKQDCETVRELDKIHNECEYFSNFYGFRIESIFYEYKDTLEKELDLEPVLLDEWRNTYEYQKQYINRDLYLKFRNNVFKSSIHPFNSKGDIPNSLLEYDIAFKEYLLAVQRICCTPMTISRFQFLPNLFYNHDLSVGDLCMTGEAFVKLEVSHKKVKAYYRDIWH